MTRQQLYADLPADLQEADDILRRYGRWARGGGGGGARCGSAEGAYRSPQDDEDRQPSEPTMAAIDVERTRKALATLPTMTLCVIQWLYVDSSSLQSKMRKHGVQPRHMQERHLEGVRLFWSEWSRCEKTSRTPVAIASALV